MDQGTAPGGCEKCLDSGYLLKIVSLQNLLVNLLWGVGGEGPEMAPSCQPDPLELLFPELGTVEWDVGWGTMLCIDAFETSR